MMEMGAEYDVAGSGIECTNCLFAEVCRRAPVICGFHAGLLEGLLESFGQPTRIEALGFRGTNGCAYRAF
jgi:predicted ArsR family transcriptional regulator